MKKIFLFFFLYFISKSVCIHASDNDGKTFVGINLGHTLAVSFVSTMMDQKVAYVPVHLIINHSFNDNFGISGVLLYRSEKDGDNFLTYEMGFAAGPSYLSNSLKGFYMDCKFGLAFASGRDYDSNEYSRSDFVIQPDIGYYLDLGNRFSMILGMGFQTLLLLSENPARTSVYPSWDWNGIGKMSHHYLPVLNISIGVKL